MRNPKGDLIEYCRALRLRNPKFETRGTGSDHEPLFITDILVDGEVRATGQGSSKRDSERMASELALESLHMQYGPSPQREVRRSQSGSPEGERSSARISHNDDYPIYADVLVSAMQIANSRVDGNRRGPESIDLVRKLTLDLYKGLLEELGATAEEEDEAFESLEGTRA